jgi:energy-coupling factor transport system substrate-specific component
VKSTVKRLSAVAIGASLYFLTARYLSPHIFANVRFCGQYGILGIFAVFFGPATGIAIGFIGQALFEFTLGYGILWSRVFCSAIIGCASGFLLIGVKMDEGVFGIRGILQFVAGSIAIHMGGWGLFAPVFEVLVYAESAKESFERGLAVGIANAAVAALLGTLFLLGFARAMRKG